MRKTIIIWVIAILITVGAAYFQRKTGPTHAVDASITVDGTEYKFELPRSHAGTNDHEISLAFPDTKVKGEIHYRRYPTEEPWTTVELSRDGDNLVGHLPGQPPAGKLEYYLTFTHEQEPIRIPEKAPVIIRFTGDVPAFVLIPHVAFIFAGMLISNLAGIFALTKDKRYKFYTFLAFGLLTIGGMIFGPIVQQYAFDALWTGVPFGWDLTDNKTLIAFLAFLIAIIGIRKKDRYYLTIIAAIIVIVIFAIPHSVMGSELNYSSGTITTG